MRSRPCAFSLQSRVDRLRDAQPPRAAGWKRAESAITCVSYISWLRNTGFVVITIPAMEPKVQVVFRENAKRVKPNLVAGQLVCDDVGIVRVPQRGLQHMNWALA